MSRPIVEPGGILLIGVGMNEADLDQWSDRLYAQAPSLSVLITAEQQLIRFRADEVFVYGALGLRGALALIRRISWRHFDLVVQPADAGLPYLRHFIWPQPAWQCGEYLVDFRP